MAEKRYKEINGVRYEVVPNPDTGSNVIPLPDPKELPAIKSGDGGKVLTVKEDESGTEWEAAPGGGGSDLLTVVFAEDGAAVSTNYTGQQIANAIVAGKPITFIYKNINDGQPEAISNTAWLEQNEDDEYNLNKVVVLFCYNSSGAMLELMSLTIRGNIVSRTFYSLKLSALD